MIKLDDSFDKRIDMLEMAVYKKDPETGTNTLIEQIESDIRKIQVDTVTNHQELKNKFDSVAMNVGESIFKFEQRMT